MSISKELYLAILAMDSYNRGYGAGIADGDTNDQDGLGEAGSQIGDAAVLNIPLPFGSQPAGFYAVAYQTEDYGTIISYRGTDGLTLGGDTIQGGSDIINGWLAGAGQETSQTGLAIEFYERAVGWAPTRHSHPEPPHPKSLTNP